MKLKKTHKDIIFKNNSGFTLIEAMIAIAIFAIGFLAVGLMQINAMTTTNSARRITEALALAENQAELLRALPFYDDDQDLDGVGGVEPFDMLPVFTGANPHVLNSPGPYTVWWTVDDTQPLPGYAPGVLVTGIRIPNSMMIRIWVTPDNAAADILAEIEFAKYCGRPI